jgi:SAM-dependent methyltransferase
MNLPADRYAFDNNAAYASEQLATLETYLDPVTTGVLRGLPLLPDARCLDIGAGAGSVTRWLAGQLGPDAHVLATDLDPTHLRGLATDLAEGRPSRASVEVVRHDIRTGPPAGGPWDLVHARLLLLHLPSRRTILQQLAASVAPGGWLVLGEFSNHPLTVITAAADHDCAVFYRVTDALVEVLSGHGADLDWAHAMHPAMIDAGLTGIHTTEYAESWTGGSPGARLHHINARQKQQQLLAGGVTTADLAHFHRLMCDPAFTTRSWQFVTTRGQQPIRRSP